jgi:hypothetical protein
MYYVGLDLGAKRDYSALAVVEKVERRQTYQNPEAGTLLLRHVERVPLGTPYAEVVGMVRDTVWDPELAGQCVVVADATGLGAPVIEMLRAARMGCDITAVTITSGDRAVQRGNDWSVPKRDLIAGVQVLLEANELRIARGLRDAGALVQELVDVRTTVRGAGRVRYGADGCGEHDDLVIALALACWRAKRREIDMRGCALPGMPWK